MLVVKFSLSVELNFDYLLKHIVLVVIKLH